MSAQIHLLESSRAEPSRVLIVAEYSAFFFVQKLAKFAHNLAKFAPKWDD